MNATTTKAVQPAASPGTPRNPFVRFIKSFDKWKAWIYLLPAIILLLIFTVWPIINTIRISLLEGYEMMAAVGGETFNFGFHNYVEVFEVDGFLDCLKTTMILCFVTVPLSTFLALLISVCLNAIKPFKRFLQTIFFLPYVTNSIAIGMVFAAMFNIVGSFLGQPGEIIESPGIINSIIRFISGNDSFYINWINSGSTYFHNILVMIIYITWHALPFKILILLGGLQSVNKQYYEAAKVDGTSRIRTFWRITVPMLSPMIAYVVITGFIGGFKEYSSIVGIFGPHMGPAGDRGRLNTMVGFIYDSLSNHVGRASAAALVLFGIILIVTLINLWVSKKKVHY